MADEDSVQVSTGQKVRAVKLTTLVDGVLTDVEMEVIAISDADGNVLDLSGTKLLDAIETLINEIREFHDSYKFNNGM